MKPTSIKEFNQLISTLESIKDEFRPKYPTHLGANWKEENGGIDNLFRVVWEELRKDFNLLIINANKEQISELNLWIKKAKSCKRDEYKSNKEWAFYTLEREPVNDMEFDIHNVYLKRWLDPWFKEMAEAIAPSIKLLLKGRQEKLNRDKHPVDRHNTGAVVKKCEAFLDSFNALAKDPTTEVYDLPNRINTYEGQKVVSEEPVATSIISEVNCPHCFKSIEAMVSIK